MHRTTYSLFADYFQFYLQDELAEGIDGDSWDEIAFARLLATAPGTIGIGTVRNMTVPVVVEIHDHEPPEDADMWDHIIECSIVVSSGKIVIAGCTDYFPDAARIEVAPGIYAARISYGALDSLSEDEIEGDDHYRVQLWPGAVGELRVVKQRTVS